MHEERFSTLRALLLEDPSPDIWEQIADLFGDWNVEDGIEVALTYANQHLQDWPPYLRRAPEDWVRVLLGENKALIKRKWRSRERAHPGFAIVRNLILPYSRKALKLKTLNQFNKGEIFKSLEAIVCQGITLGDNGALALSTCTKPSALHTLILDNNDIGPQGVWDLAESTFFAGLSTLHIRNNKLGDEGLRGLADCPHLEGLRHLHLSGVGGAKEGAEALAASPYLTQLETLHLGHDYYWENKAAYLLAFQDAPCLATLRCFGFAGAQLDDDLIDTFVTLPFQQLRKLDISSNPFTIAGAKKLVECGALQGLETIQCTYIETEIQQVVRDHFGEDAVITEDKNPWM